MSQINKYSVQRVQPEILQQEFSEKDRALIKSYDLGNIPFLPEKYQLNGTFYTLDGIFLETVQDLKTYTVLGINQKEAATEISVDPVQDVLDKGYLGDIQIEYTVTNNLFSPSHIQDPEGILFIREISSDRTELRATSTTLSENQLQGFAQELYIKLNELAPFRGVKLQFLDENISCWCTNIMTEVLDGSLVVTFKTYEPLPDEIGDKSRFTVQEQIGEPIRFEVIRTVEIVEDEKQQLRLKGPNFDVESGTEAEIGTVTDYLNFQELFSYPESIRSSNLYSIYKEQGIELSVDHSDFSNFIHFSSAAERLENFRYKLGLIQGYQQELGITAIESEKVRLKGLIQGIIDNFDHYDRYLYFENTETSWPKESSARPYVNVSLEEAADWFEHELQRAQEYDEHNPDILINTIPQVIRLDSRNEPYLVFVHMIGQHFDEEWIYAKVVADRYNADNRLDFGISKDLVQEALRSFGVELETGNQNLERLFDLCVPGQPYNTGSEASVQEFERATVNLDGHNEALRSIEGVHDGEYVYPVGRPGDPDLDGEYSTPYTNVTETRIDEETGEEYQVVVGRRPEPDGHRTVDAGTLLDGWTGTTEFQPVLVDDYRKEIYKRIYHNIPLLLKTKGTSRGLRALISCFGIPEDLLEIAVAGGADLDQEGAFFGPEYFTTSSKDRIHLNNQGTRAVQMFDETAGTFVSGTVLSLDRQIQQPGRRYQPGTNSVGVGFRLNGQFDQQVKDYLITSSSEFDYDNLIGDPRNTGEDYGEAFTLLRNQIIADLRGDSRELPIRTPSAVLRLIRYYDSVLFRTLQSFVPARDVVSTGAIVDDNILHRNRYKGIESEGKDLGEVTGSIETVFIDGGEAGSLKVLRGGRPEGKAPQVQNFVIRVTVSSSVTESRECPSVNYSEEMGQTIGSEYVPKVVFDDSPKFNGELAGTEYEITDGELNSENMFKIGGTVQKVLNYLLDYRFLCLPRVPVDTVLRATGQENGLYFTINSDFAGNYPISVRMNDQDVSNPQNIIATSTLSLGTEFSITVPSGENKGGWIYASDILLGSNDKWTNYIGVDPDMLRYIGDANKEQIIGAELNRALTALSGNLKAILLPVFSSGQAQIMGASLDFKPDDKNFLWEKVFSKKSTQRQIYPRVLNRTDFQENQKDRLLLRIHDTDRWGGVGDTITEVTGAISNELFSVLDPETGRYIAPDTAETLLRDIGLLRIYVSIPTRETGVSVKVLSVVDDKAWDYNTSSDDDDDTIWKKFKGYGNVEGWNTKDYLYLRYREVEKPQVIGVWTIDSVVGTAIESGSLAGKKAVLLESYMGCPYVFANNGTTPKYELLLIEDWE